MIVQDVAANVVLMFASIVIVARGDEDRLLEMIEKARGKAVADKLKLEARAIVREHIK